MTKLFVEQTLAKYWIKFVDSRTEIVFQNLPSSWGITFISGSFMEVRTVQAGFPTPCDVCKPQSMIVGFNKKNLLQQYLKSVGDISYYFIIGHEFQLFLFIKNNYTYILFSILL